MAGVSNSHPVWKKNCKLRRYSYGEIWPESCWQKGFQGKQKTGLQYEDSHQTHIFCLPSVNSIHMDPTWTRRLFDFKPTQQATFCPFRMLPTSLVWFSLPSASVKAEAPAAGAWTKGVGRLPETNRKLAPETNGWLEDGPPFLLGWKAYCSGTVAVSFREGIFFNFFFGLRNFDECMAILVWNGHFLKTHKVWFFWGCPPRKCSGWSG